MVRVNVFVLTMVLAAACRGTGGPAASAPAHAPDSGTDGAEPAAAAVKAIADEYLAALLERRPTGGYFIDRPPARHDGFEDNSLRALAAWHTVEDAFLARIRNVDAAQLEGRAEWITHGALRERLEGQIQARVCRRELWPVSQMIGWQIRYLDVARVQPVGTAEERDQALRRWRNLAGYLDNEIALLKQGLAEGYSAPKSNVRRVLVQLDGYLKLPIENDPFYAIALRSDDAAFHSAFRALVAEGIRPAVVRYRDFLKNTYLPKARSALAVTANPNGRACYEALLRGYTTLVRSPEDVFALGQKTVAANRKVVIEKGQALFGTKDYSKILEGLNDVEGDRFDGRDAVIAFARERVRAAAGAMPPYFVGLPPDEAVVQPYPAHLDGTGVSSRYEAPKGGSPGTYRIAVNDPTHARRGREEIVAYHETYPGHHLQIAFEQRLKGLHPVGRVTRNAAFIEGWARYSEALAEEIGLYESPTGPIFRRTWPARGMVVDPGIHVMGWDRERAVEFLMASGRFERTDADRMVDRIATIPGQLTSYDSGALEIFALRAKAEADLKDRFDLAKFHQAVLENGTIPLSMLRTHIHLWIDRQR